ncbi:MAG TPA: patatin-like phospholipase family protein [Solirubrobacteraceae bacterium]|nr:patatin-like phospholipase family protein [Solirubrobacteraceae bacterium]
MLTRPDVLVLGAGGVLGEAWMTGVLAGIEEATGFDLRRCEAFVGTSAGAIVAAQLAAGQSPRRPGRTPVEREAPEERPVDGLAAAALTAARWAGAFALNAAAAFAPLALGAAAPGGALMRGAMLRRLPRPRSTLGALRDNIERSGARFDGRLRVVAVDRRSGRRVVFGSPGAPRASVADAVTASCTVPWLFAPVQIGEREYVDGGVWSPTNLDAAPAGRDTHVLCLHPMANIVGSHPLLAMIRRVGRSAVSLEALAVRRRGAVVQWVAPDPEAAAAMGSNFMDRAPRARVLAAGFHQGLDAARRGLR